MFEVNNISIYRKCLKSEFLRQFSSDIISKYFFVKTCVVYDHFLQEIVGTIFEVEMRLFELSSQCQTETYILNAEMRMAFSNFRKEIILIRATFPLFSYYLRKTAGSVGIVLTSQ